jgi:hypothetical protein
MATINHKTYNEATETFKDFNVYDGKETLIFKVDGEGGNVGIGTSSPTDTIGYGRALDIQSSTGAVVYLRDSNAPTTQYGFLAFDGSDNGLKLHNANSSGFLRFDTNATEKMRITSAGNVGIGTTTSSYDTNKIGSGHRFLNVQAGAGSYAVGTLAGNQSLNGDRLGYLTFVNDNNSASYKYSAWLGAEVDGTTTNQQGGRLIFSTMGDGSSAGPIERMRITQAGNVGIGTASPTRKLQVKGAVGFEATNSTNFWELYNYTDNTLRFNYNGSGSDEITITSAGNVGIGNSSPTATLDVTGTLTASGIASLGIGETTELAFIGDRTTVNTRYIKFVRASAVTDIVNIQGVNGGVGNTDIALQAGGGNVGIGTSSPSRKLTIADGTGGGDPTDSRTKLYIDSSTESYISLNVPADSYEGIRMAIAGTNKSTLEYWDDTAAGKKLWISTVSSDPIVFATTNTERVRITATGNVGIGTTSPANKLQMGSVGGTGYSGNYIAWGDGTRAGAIDINATGSFLYATHDQIFGPGSAEKMRITSAGNVGIGTTAPESRLHVAGSAAGSDVTLYIDNAAPSTLNNSSRLKFSSDAGSNVSGGGAELNCLVVTAVNGAVDLLVKSWTGGAYTEKARFLADGGLTFNGDTAAANALDDYEEGTWTPTFIFGSGSVTYTVTTGTYTKIGRQVVVRMKIVVNVASSPSGTLEVAGMPFTAASGTIGSISVLGSALAATSTQLVGTVTGSSTTMRLYDYASGSLANPAADLQDGSGIDITATYFV